MGKELTEDQIKAAAAEFNIEYPALRAVIEVESRGDGFCKNGIDPVIQFEPHVFKKFTGIQIKNGYEFQAAEWEAYKEAWEIDQEAARCSTSWGLGQIMGYNFKQAGYKSSAAMVMAFYKNELEQLKGMIQFILNDNRLAEALRRRDWTTFARIYNGPLYYKNDYDRKLQRAFLKYAAA